MLKNFDGNCEYKAGFVARGLGKQELSTLVHREDNYG